ncbi:hypothetical protein [Silanimonas sp.]|jgi:hypothetical protein|uniref:hypothetical protein n=1 Tax=Silanimonas sp. TaxID=1929290 RepID=UPI0022CAD614|nr:hypothetical protein [Silanimonas sp.]MCZ8114181.1 hypothetical protein [Silanimonas sp.]
MSLLAVLLLAPWFAVLGWIYWRTAPARFASARGFDIAALAGAIALSVAGMVAGLQVEPAGHHPIIREIVASLIAYKGFLLVLVAAWFWRRRGSASVPASAASRA